MTPIIDPMIFYWIGVCENLGVFMTILAILSGVAIAIVWVTIGVSIDFCCYDVDDAAAISKGRK